MNWENIKTNIDFINKIVTTTTIAIGGLWVLYTFDAELRSENASAKLEKTIRETDALKRKVIEVVVDSKIISQFEGEYLIEITVLISNKGGIKHELPLRENSLRITRIKIPKLPMQPQLKRVQFKPVPLITNKKGDAMKVNSLFLPAGGQNSLLYLARVDQYGSFLIEFSAQDTKHDLNIELTASEIIHILPQDSNATYKAD